MGARASTSPLPQSRASTCPIRRSSWHVSGDAGKWLPTPLCCWVRTPRRRPRMGDKVNGTLDDHEKVQFLAIVNEEWLPENGFCTPTNKIKRGKIEEEHESVLEEWYGSKKKVIWYKW